MLRKNRHLSLCQWLIAIALFLLFLFTVIFLYTNRNENHRFEQYTTKLFRTELSSNLLSLHYTLANPQTYNIERNSVFPVYEKSTVSDTKLEMEQALDTLSSFHSDRLSSENAYTLSLLNAYLKSRLTLTEYSCYAEPFSPSSGMQSGIPILLADYTFRSRQDIEDYFSILEAIPAYFDGLLVMEKEKAAGGLFMSEQAAQKVISQCDTILDPEELAAGTHFLQLTFTQRLQSLLADASIANGSNHALPANNSDHALTTEELTLLQAENDRLLTTVVQPAYEKVADTLELLSDTGKNPDGLCHFPNGKEYYRCLLQATTGSSRSIAEWKKLLQQDYQVQYQALLSLLQQHPDLLQTSKQFFTEASCKQASDILRDLQRQTVADYPLPEGTVMPSATIKQVSACMEPYTSPAYYLTPPIDDWTHNIIYLNSRENRDTLTLYTTLAHEGYPGHLYQTVYYQQSHAKNATPIRHILNYGGYVEGWALYAEIYSYDYLISAFSDRSSPDAASYCTLIEACRLERKLQLCLYSLLDIAIHYDGITSKETAALLAPLGITDTATVQNLYEYIVEEPTTYPKYYMGYLELTYLKEEARRLWGSDYSDLRFHTFVLNAGPSDFTNLELLLYHTV